MNDMVVITFLAVYGIVYTVAFGWLFTRYLKLKKRPQVLDISRDEATDILDSVIADVIVDLELQYEAKEVKFIKNPDEDVKKATAEVLQLISEQTMNTLLQYNTKRYILTYITRSLRSFIFAYLNKKN